VFKFFSAEDMRIWTGGPWVIAGQVLVVEECCPNFLREELEGKFMDGFLHSIGEEQHYSRSQPKLGNLCGLKTQQSKWKRVVMPSSACK